jgi:LL-diaminopimelate aminotransferase
MKFSRRISQLKPYPFVEISRVIAQKKAEGIEVVTFGIGDPDIPTPKPIVDQLIRASKKSSNHRYPETDGLPEVRKAITQWYKNRFGVDHLDPESEVLPLIGAKEGIGHVAFCFIDPGDIALVPDPAYPVYEVGTMFAGGKSYPVPLLEDNQWLADIGNIPPDIARKAKVMWVNYPNNPTSAVANKEHYMELIAFAREYDIAILHDAAYSEVVYDGYKALSFMELPGAKEVGIEFHSLSKCFNMTGWRFGSAVGNSDMINALFQIKSNLDSGIPQAIQEMAIEAMTGDQSYIDYNNITYTRRRDKVVGALRRLSLKCSSPKASLYIWARVPEGYSSRTFSAQLLEDTNIVVTPGSSYGNYGEGYIRLSLTTPDEMIDKGIERLNQWHIPPAPES